MRQDTRVALGGIFSSPDAAGAALAALRRVGFDDVVTHSPVADPFRSATRREAMIGWFAFGGAAAGAVTGLLLTSGTARQWPLMTGGQPIVSLPPFLIISFELTILFGVLATTCALFWRICRNRSDPGFYNPRFSADRFGVYVACEQERVDLVRELLSAAGAEEVRYARS